MNTEKETLGAAFNEAYASLNAAQKDAVDTIEGPVMVIAGPGTGKTQILTLRIAKILLETDMQPENILALTFTEAGAKAMRERLRQYLGARAYQVSIHTFHGLAERLIRDYPDAYTRVIGGRPASELEKVSMIESILADPTFKLLRPTGNPEYYIAAIIRTISTLKKEYVTPDGLAEIIDGEERVLNGMERVHEKGAHKGKVRSEYSKKEKSLAKNRELLQVYRRYEASLGEQRLYDFEDMIVETVTALETQEDMLRDLQESYQYILADEHQDVNGSQNKILELLSSFHDAPNIFVVGDEKQAIFRFQGASLENFLYFTDLFPQAKQIDLTENYRSGQAILDAAHSLVAVSEGPLKDLRRPLRAASVEQATIEGREFSHEAIENEWIVDTVKKAIAAGTPLSEIAIIVRTNREVEHLAALLRTAGLPANASADGDILEHPVTHTIDQLIAAVVTSNNDAALFSLLHGTYWGLPPSDVVKIARARSHERPLPAILSDRGVLTKIGVEAVAAAEHIHTTISQARERSELWPAHRVLEFLLTESGYLEHILKLDPLESGRVIRRVYDEVEKWVLRDQATTLREVREVFAQHRAHRLPLSAPYITAGEEAVTVLTAHKSKGLEFGTVIVAHLVDRAWGGGRSRTDFDIPLTHLVDADQFDRLDDERRLLYVAMTRAKDTLHLTSSQQNQEGKELVVSRLLSDIDPACLPQVATTEAEAAFDPLRTLGQPPAGMLLSTELFTQYLTERGLSATALNNYLSSPYNFLYRNVLQIPELQTPALQFGTALHGVMEYVTSMVVRTGSLPNMTQVSEQLATELGRLPLSTEELTRLHEKGLAALSAYLSETGERVTPNAKGEFSLRVMLPTGLADFPELTLTGKLDRLDRSDDGQVLRVVDYKTGTPKSRNEIEGKTKDATGNYKRQLVFYALMLSLLEDERYQCRTGVISFLEPNARGKIKEEIFTITDAEIEELQAELIRVTQEIVTGSFLEMPCDPEASPYCHLAAALAGDRG